MGRSLNYVSNPGYVVYTIYDFRQKLRREFTHAQNFLFKIAAQSARMREFSSQFLPEIECTLNCRSVVREKGRQFHACAFIAIQNQWDLTRMREIDDFFCDNRPAIQCTAVLQNLAKNSNVNFSACVKFHVENEWDILRMCEIDV